MVVLLALAGTGQEAVRADGDKTTATPAGVLLSEAYYWRKHYTFLLPRVSVKAAKAAGIGLEPAARTKHIARFHHGGIETAPPPAAWAQVDFDDSSWQMARGRQFVVGDRRLNKRLPSDRTSVWLRGNDPFVEEIGLICQRGTFRVNDRAKVRKLTLSVAYRGGMVAYLNGQEIARQFLPSGRIAPDTVADDYPLTAFFERSSIGAKALVRLDSRAHRDSDQWEIRERKFGPKDIPLDGLRDGENVLAIELHRADYPAECRIKKVHFRTPRSLGWATVGMATMTLRADAAGGAVASLRPEAKGFQVWTRDITRPVGAHECPNFDDGPTPIHVVGARNGFFSGQVVVRSDAVLKGLRAAASALTQVGGQGQIPAAAVTVRYGAVNPTQANVPLDYLTAVLPPGAATDKPPSDPANALHARFDALLDSPPAGAASMPVWVTVNVPAGVPGGDYTGSLTVAAGAGKPVRVPIELHLADWTLPDVKDYGSLINIYQSPETLAQYYKVAPWSEAHWRLIERSLTLMGEAGNIGIFVPLLSRSALGNPDSMVPWIAQPDGSYKYDFTVFDRYIATAVKHHARLRFIAVNVWGYEVRSKRGAPPAGGTVTVVDPRTGEKADRKLPAYGTPECEKLWKPVLAALRERLAAKGLDKLLLLGLPADGGPTWQTTAMFRRILPGVAWVRESHFNKPSFQYDPKDKAKVVPVAYNSIVWGGAVPDPAVKRMYGWRHNPKHLVMTFNRAGASALVLKGFPPPWSYRMWMESTLAGGRNGNGRVGGDYWHLGARFVGKTADGRRVRSATQGGSSGTLFGIYLKSAVGQVGLGNSTTDLFAPAPDGPVTTVRFENAREGNQEAEARIFIERALLDKAHPLDASLARKCRALLDERTNVLRMWPADAGEIARLGWQRRSRQLYEAAAEVARARTK